MDRILGPVIGVQKVVLVGQPLVVVRPKARPAPVDHKGSLEVVGRPAVVDHTAAGPVELQEG